MRDKYQELEPLVAKYKEEIDAVHVRRALWQSKTRILIENTLEQFIQTFDLKCFVKTDDQVVNQEVVFMGFEEEDSGIKMQGEDKGITRIGGGILYVQNVNGKVSTFIIFPFIDKVKGKAGEQEEIDMQKPEDIDEDLILSHLIRCFKEILEWECFLRQPIGFKQKNADG